MQSGKDLPGAEGDQPFIPEWFEAVQQRFGHRAVHEPEQSKVSCATSIFGNSANLWFVRLVAAVNERF